MSWGLYIPNSIFYIIQIVLRVIDIIRVNFTTVLPRFKILTTLNQIKTNTLPIHSFGFIPMFARVKL